MHDLLMIGIANFLFIGLKSFQQLNVVHGERLLVFVTSHLMALTEVFLVASYAHYGAIAPLIFTVGVSGGAGSVTAMMIRAKFFRHNKL